MKSILLSGTAAVLLMAASGALAAQPDNHQGDHPDATHASGPADTHAGGDTHMSGPADQHNTMSGTNKTTTTHTTTHRTHTRRRTTTRSTGTMASHDNKNDHGTNGPGDHNNNAPDNNNDHGSNSHAHGQFSANLRVSINATHHFRGPTWHAPAGYTYRRYTVGQRLEPAFYARDYWLSDYAAYDLLAPPDGYTWVRFGPDAILIDEDTGEVVRVVYGVFE